MKHLIRNTLALAVASRLRWRRRIRLDFDSSTYLPKYSATNTLTMTAKLEYDPNLAMGLGHEFNRRFAAEFVYGGAGKPKNPKFLKTSTPNSIAWTSCIISGKKSGPYRGRCRQPRNPAPQPKTQDETQYNLGLGLA